MRITMDSDHFQGVNTLVRYGVEGETPEVRRAALRCVANALLLDPKMRQAFVDTGYGGKVAEKLKVWPQQVKCCYQR